VQQKQMAFLSADADGRVDKKLEVRDAFDLTAASA